MKRVIFASAIIFTTFVADISYAEDGVYTAALKAWRNLIVPERCVTMFEGTGAGSVLIPLFVDYKIIKDTSQFKESCLRFPETAKRLKRKYGLNVGDLYYKQSYELKNKHHEKSPLAIHFINYSYEMRVVEIIFNLSHKNDPDMQRKGFTFFLRCPNETCEKGELVGFDDVLKANRPE